MALVAADCECAPARSKPWRHARDTALVADSTLGSEVLAAESARVQALAHRRHTLRIQVDSELRQLVPLVAPTEWTLRVAADTVFETLLRYEPPSGGAGSGPGSYRPGLAQSFRIAPSGREIRIDLEPEVLFHDGKRMTSIDVQFSLDAARDPRNGADHLVRALASVIAVELINPRALRIRLERPDGYVLRALAEVPILPAAVYQGNLRPGRDPVIGTGPYRLASWQDHIIRLTRFDKYWGRAPAIPDIEFVYQPDAAEALTAAKRGELDLVPELVRSHYPGQASAPGVVSSFVPLRLRPTRFRYLALAASRPALADPRVRQAIALLVDRPTLVKEVYGGLARPIAGPIWPGGPGDGPAPAPPLYDPAQAAALLDSAGWQDRDGDGVRERDGVRLLLSVLLVENPDAVEAAERDQILRGLRRSGIRIEQRVGTPAVLRNRLRAGDFDLAFIEWRGAVDSDLAPLLGTGGSQNFGQMSSRRIDDALDALREAWEPAARPPLMAELARAIAETWPLVPLCAPEPYGLLHRRVRGAVVWNGWISLRALSLAPGED